MHRVFDLALASVALVALAPVMGCIAVISRYASAGPVLFRQERIGQHGKPFTMIKFRSLGHDGIPTRIGTVLRRYSLDELPEFWNVLRGDMALVGPRPMIEADQPTQPRLRRLRQQIRPGMTGWAQINGRNALPFEQTFLLDLWYARHKTLWLDLYILAATLPCVVSGRGACGLAASSRPSANRRRKTVQAPL